MVWQFYHHFLLYFLKLPVELFIRRVAGFFLGLSFRVDVKENPNSWNLSRYCVSDILEVHRLSEIALSDPDILNWLPGSIVTSKTIKEYVEHLLWLSDTWTCGDTLSSKFRKLNAGIYIYEGPLWALLSMTHTSIPSEETGNPTHCFCLLLSPSFDSSLIHFSKIISVFYITSSGHEVITLQTDHRWL